MLSIRPLIRAINRVFGAWVALACLAFLMLTALTFPAFAQDGGGTDVIGTLGIVALVAGVVVSLAASGWSLFVSYAAKSEATWDNWVVARVRDLARSVVKEEQSGTSPIPPTPLAAK